MIQENLKVPYSFAPAHVNKQEQLQWQPWRDLCERGQIVTAMEHVPEYLSFPGRA